MIEGFKIGKKYGKIRAISMKVQDKEDIDNAMKLADLKVRA
jgi:hypothetical protein